MQHSRNKQVIERQTELDGWARATMFSLIKKRTYTILGYTQTTKIAANGKKKKSLRLEKEEEEKEEILSNPMRCLYTHGAV